MPSPTTPSFSNSTATRSWLAVLAATGSLAAQDLIHDSGPIQSAATGGGPAATSPVSVLQSLAPTFHTVYGYGAQQTGPNRLLDDFAVGQPMQIDQIEVFGYSTGVQVPSCTGVYLSIWDADPASGPANQLLGGAGNTTNLVFAPGFAVNNTMTGVFRALDTTITNATRPIQSVLVTLPTPLILPTGTYHLEFSFNGVNFAPPLSTTNVLSTGDARQSLAGVYAPLWNGNGHPGLPFRFYGNAGAAAPLWSINNLHGGCSSAFMQLAGAPTIGGYLRAELVDIDPSAIGCIIIGTSDPNVPLFACGCVSHASFDVLSIGNVYELTVPMNPALVGAELFFQGAQIAFVAGVAGCDLGGGLGFDLTDGYRWSQNDDPVLEDVFFFDPAGQFMHLAIPAPGQPIDFDVFDIAPGLQPHTVTWSTTSPQLTVTPAMSTIGLGGINRHAIQLHAPALANPEEATIIATVSGPQWNGQVIRKVRASPPLAYATCRIRSTEGGQTKLLATNVIKSNESFRKFASHHLGGTGQPGQFRSLLVLHAYGQQSVRTIDYSCAPWSGCLPGESCSGNLSISGAAGSKTFRLNCHCQ